MSLTQSELDAVTKNVLRRKQWFVNPVTGNDSNTGHSFDAPIATFNRLVNDPGTTGDKLGRNDQINLYTGVVYSEKLLIPDGYTLSRDVRGVYLSGNGAIFDNAGNLTNTIPLEIKQPEWIIEDITIFHRFTLSLHAALQISASGVIRGCTIHGADGIVVIATKDQNNAYYVPGDVLIDRCYIDCGEVGIYVDAASASTLVVRDTPVIMNDAWDECWTWAISPAPRTSIINSPIIVTAAKGDDDQQGAAAIALYTNVVYLLIANSPMLIRGRLGNSECWVFASQDVTPAPFTITELIIDRSDITSPGDVRSEITITNNAIMQSYFTVLSGGSGTTLPWT